MTKKIYFDNSATTALSEKVKLKMYEAIDTFGNPSSLHAAGLEAQKMVDAARRELLLALSVRQFSGKIVFTASGTEANNLALFGCCYAKTRRTANKIIATDSEHPSVENTLRRLEQDRFEIIRIPTKNGVLDLDFAEQALRGDVFMVSAMMVNNESGALYDVGRLFSMAKKTNREIITHCDAVQGFMKVRISPAELCADLLTVSSHKIHGPKGVGALYIDSNIIRSKKIVPIILGGGQEDGFRSGTENVLGIVGFGEAVRDFWNDFDSRTNKMAELRRYLIDKLSQAEVKLNIPKGAVAPHVLNITLPNIKSETMLHYLSGKGIYVSSGSACSSRSLKPSSALIAFGLSPKEADCSLRISLSEFNSKIEADELIVALNSGISTLVRQK